MRQQLVEAARGDGWRWHGEMAATWAVEAELQMGLWPAMAEQTAKSKACTKGSVAVGPATPPYWGLVLPRHGQVT